MVLGCVHVQETMVLWYYCNMAELYHRLLKKITSVTLQTEEVLTIFSTQTILSGMVRDVGVTALAVSSTIHRGFANNFLNQLLTILK